MTESLETSVLRIWREHFGPDADTRTSLFDRGGSSLTATEIAAAVLARTGRRVRVRTVLAHPTPEALVAAMIASPGDPAARPGVVEPRGGPDGVAGPDPATVQQEAIWFLEQMQPDNIAYNTIVAVRLSGDLDVDRLSRACAAVVARHDVLRTPFGTIDGELAQLPARDVRPHLVVLDRRDVDPRRIDEEIRALGRVTFDLLDPPLLNWTLLRTAADAWTLVQVEHHFVHDGWSSWLLLSDLAASYRGAERAAAPVPGAYRAFARWQRSWLAGPSADVERRWWTEQLAGCAGTGLRWDRPGGRPEYFAHSGDTVEHVLPAEVVAAVGTLAAALQATPFTVLMAAFAVLMADCSESPDFALGSMVRNRADPVAAGVVGMFVATIAVPVRGAPDHTLRTLVASLAEFLAESDEHCDLPFPLVVEALGLPRDLSRNPVFDACFSFNDWPDPALDVGPGLRAEVDFPSNGGAKFDLDVVLMRHAEGYRLLWRYYDAVLDAAEVACFARMLDALVLRLVDEPDRPLREVRRTVGAG